MIGIAIELHVGHGLCVWVAYAERTGRPLNPNGLLAILGMVFLYLHWEVMRKTAWPGTTKPGEKLYSDEVGSMASAVIAFAMIAGASGLYLWLTRGWLFLLPLGMAVINLTLFFKNRRPRALSGRLAARSYFAFLFVMLMCAFTLGVG
ncbi:hypothetical protein [Corallococcus sp. AS-1-6]|uniref:hypothetical protein n=1 Tax=Corallococcus sp. AS-1-6 TaxID=2874599 RepID=UPI001CBBDA6B|nr:hypothetical protein [Corallococcus sp. AS-1-6]MBZ4370052.1 hypothetical protein [Corallococcus sp. AS-1-6]